MMEIPNKHNVATVLTVYGIETIGNNSSCKNCLVATVLTVYGIETQWMDFKRFCCERLQQYLPFTVLKQLVEFDQFKELDSCNSTYRLRY